MSVQTHYFILFLIFYVGIQSGTVDNTDLDFEETHNLIETLDNTPFIG